MSRLTNKSITEIIQICLKLFANWNFDILAENLQWTVIYLEALEKLLRRSITD